jgi:hypothetical protein
LSFSTGCREDFCGLSAASAALSRLESQICDYQASPVPSGVVLAVAGSTQRDVVLGVRGVQPIDVSSTLVRPEVLQWGAMRQGRFPELPCGPTVGARLVVDVTGPPMGSRVPDPFLELSRSDRWRPPSSPKPGMNRRTCCSTLRRIPSCRDRRRHAAQPVPP